mmetsp:Transcript_1907/g.7444  ORF Transcript_1907/g.7444 Transcript_1907/m.7444 type:complete len:292 (-) Transcript_1907:288-1163(-)
MPRMSGTMAYLRGDAFSGGCTRQASRHATSTTSMSKRSRAHRTSPGTCKPPYNRLTVSISGALNALFTPSIATSLRRATKTGSVEPPPAGPSACALTIICANAKRRADSKSPDAQQSTIAPKTSDGRPPAHTQSSSNKCASGHGTNQQLNRANSLAGSPSDALPNAVTASASSAGGRFPPIDTALRFAFRVVSSAVFAVISPASRRSAINSSRVTSATYHPRALASSASSCARNPCAFASARASAVGASASLNRHSFSPRSSLASKCFLDVISSTSVASFSRVSKSFATPR